MRSYSFAEAFDAVSEIARARGHDDFKIEVSAWRVSPAHNSGSIQWQIWVPALERHFNGATADDVIRAYREDINQHTSPVTREALAEIGTPQ